MADRENRGTPEQQRAETLRAASVIPETWRDEDNSVEVEFSAGARVLKYDYRAGELYWEELPLSGMDLSELNAGAHVLRSHARDMYQDLRTDVDPLDLILGSVVLGTARIEGDRAVARVMLSDQPSDAEAVAKIRSGVIRKWSYGYDKNGQPVLSIDPETGYQVRTWASHTPTEISPVPVPADAGTGTRSNQPAQQEDPMADPKKTEPVVEPTPVPTPTPIVSNEEAIRAARAEGASAEMQRQTDIRGIAGKLHLDDEAFRSHLADAKCTVEAFRAHAIDLVAERSDADPTHPQHSGIQPGGQDETGTRVKALSSALEVRMGLPPEGDILAHTPDLRGASVQDIASACLQLAGVNTRGRTRQELAEMALHSGTRAGAHSTSDFPYLTANVLNKVLAAERDVIPEYRWFEQIAARNDFSDFKARSYVDLKGMGLLPIILEGGEYESITIAEGRESMIAVKRGAEFPLTMELMVNDDLGGLLRLVRKFGRSSTITQSAICAALLSLQTMSDGELVCSLAHSNLSSSGGAPDVDKLDELDGFMRDQTDGNGEVVGMAMRYLLLPGTWRKVTEQLFSSQYKPTASTSALTVDIPKERRLYIPSLAGTNPWYGATGDTSAFEYGYLRGDGGPVVTNYQEAKSDSLIYHGRLVFGAGIIDEQAFASNPGA